MVGFLTTAAKSGTRNAAEAAKWYRKAADQGNTDAVAALGRLYFSGDGVPADDAQAAVWYKKLADADDTRAQYLLGYIYESGKSRWPASSSPRNHRQRPLNNDNKEHCAVSASSHDET
jgi:TPR repeat protein